MIEVITAALGLATALLGAILKWTNDARIDAERRRIESDEKYKKLLEERAAGWRDNDPGSIFNRMQNRP